MRVLDVEDGRAGGSLVRDVVRSAAGKTATLAQRQYDNGA